VRRAGGAAAAGQSAAVDRPAPGTESRAAGPPCQRRTGPAGRRWHGSATRIAAAPTGLAVQDQRD
jgi:hypothetical protein